MKRAIICLMCLVLLCACGNTVSCPVEEDGPVVLPEPEKAELGELAYIENSYGFVHMSLGLPEGWEYELEEYDPEAYGFGIYFWHSDYAEEKLHLYYTPSFGVCGTGLEEKVATLEGAGEVRVGTFDGRPVWDFIYFTDAPGDYVLQNGGGENYAAYGPELEAILDTITLGGDTISRSRAEAIAEGECTVPYDRVRATFDIESGVWTVHMYKANSAGGGQTVTISASGEILSNEYGE